MPFMKPYMVKLLREQFPPGTRVRLDSMMNDPQPIPKGMTGIMGAGFLSPPARMTLLW